MWEFLEIDRQNTFTPLNFCHILFVKRVVERCKLKGDAHYGCYKIS